MEKKQTAVQWLIKQIEDDSITPEQIEGQWFVIREAALKLEREQHKQTWGKGVEWGDANCAFEGETRLPKFEDYYTQTYSEPLKDKI